ncbi:MAG: dihydropteridine reductase [Candidatus Parcubacteria bacterium]|nr:MAG: dihydropteridine reductase [Candidatus Parcubacteria bacterium]
MRSNKNVGFNILIYFNILIWLIPIYYLVNLQLVKAEDFKNKISNFETNKIIIAPRGKIYVRDRNNNLYLIADIKKVYDIYFNPKLSTNIKEELETISKILNKNFDQDYYKSKSSFIIFKNTDKSTLDRILSLKFNSIFYEEKYIRIYPEKDFLSTILGFAKLNSDNNLEGEYGIEKYYDDILKGDNGMYYGIKKIQPEIPGNDLILNIDYFVQKYAEMVLSEGIREFNASGGLIIVITNNGQVIALAEEPRYDLNNFNKVEDIKIFLTKASQNYEPGSVMKAITYFIGLDRKVFKPTDKYYDAGYITENNWTIYNFDKKGRGEITFEYAFEQSLNTGAANIQKLIGNYAFLNYLKKFKFNQKPFVDFPNLSDGNIKNLEKSPRDSRNINFLTASYGHGISLSPFHLIQAFSLFANKGTMYNITFLNKIISYDNKVKEIKPKILDTFGDKYSLENIVNLLEKVTINGSGKYAQTEGYKIGGKTGSAFIPKINEPGYTNDVINTYLAIFPLTNPRFIIMVRIDKPSQGLARVTTVPLAKKIIDYLIDYYQILPDNL